MRTVTFKSVFEQIVRRCGLDPAAADFSATRQEMFADFVNLRLRRFLEHAFWPEWMVCEERAFRPEWSATATYEGGDEVYRASEDGYFVALRATTNETPETATEAWAAVTELDTLLPYAPADAIFLGTVELVADRNPDKYPEQYRELGMRPAAEGLWITGEGVGTTVWVRYRRLT